MNKILVSIIIAIPIVSSCTTTQPLVIKNTRTIHISIPDALLKCPQLKKEELPDPETLTNQQTAQLIEKLVRDNRTSGINMQQIIDYQEKAKKVHG